jgi:hypothetical protein
MEIREKLKIKIMKKIITLLAIAGFFCFASCTTSGSLKSLLRELKFLTTSFNSNNNFSRLVAFDPIYSSDVVLTYRLSGLILKEIFGNHYRKRIILIMEH